MRTSRLSILVVVMCLALTSCASRRDQSPHRDGYVVHAYHFCDKSGSLQGGVYEKGPFKQFPGPYKEECEHEWKEITRGQFKQLAAEKYNVNWNRESARFWIHDNEPMDANEESARN